MLEFFESLMTGEALWALGQVIMIDLVLAGDNAVVIGLAASGLPKDQRNKAILVGILAATVLRIGFASITTQLLQVLGLILVGGILLLWVSWKMWRELRDGHSQEEGVEAVTGEDINADGTVGAPVGRKTFAQVLAVAGAAREHPGVLVIGLVLSIALMGLAASFIARLLQKYRWIAYVGLAIILYVALEMIYRGFLEIYPVVT
jgi:YjbE family integral membrane protein